MQKEITIHEYLKSMVIALANHCYDDKLERISEGVIKTQAFIFFNIFGKDISKNLVDLACDNDLEVEGKEEYFKFLFYLYKGMAKCDADQFIYSLNVYLKE